MEERIKTIEAKKKRERRKANEKKAKFRERVQLGMHLPGDSIDAPEEQGLFSLSSIGSKASVLAVNDDTPSDELLASKSKKSHAGTSLADSKLII